MTARNWITDISIISGLLALIIFGHLTMWRGSAQAGSFPTLQLQGTGSAYASYSEPVNERLGEFERNVREMLYDLGAAEYSYAASRPEGRYGYLDELVQHGYMMPNQTGSTLVANYSISFYLPGGRRGFTLVAEPESLDLRSYMLTENQQVVLITPTVMDDPSEDWETVRNMMGNFMEERGYYDYLGPMQLLSYTPPLQIRLNRERTAYIIHQLMENPEAGFIPDEELVYISSYASYMYGDTRIYDSD